MADELVHVESAGGIATVTLDSERNRNALSRRLVTELGERLAAADADDKVRAVLLRSAGRAFCSGVDMSEALADGMGGAARAIVALQRQIIAAAKPVVVELGGPVRAGGLGIVGAADIVVAAESVTFALTEVRLGLAPAAISVTLVPRLSPRACADLLLTARTFDAAEAARIGLVTHAVPDQRLAESVRVVLDDLVQGYPQGLRETKALINRDLLVRLDQVGGDMAEQSARLFGSDEAREAMAAFLQHRQPLPRHNLRL